MQRRSLSFTLVGTAQVFEGYKVKDSDSCPASQRLTSFLIWYEEL